MVFSSPPFFTALACHLVRLFRSQDSGGELFRSQSFTRFPSSYPVLRPKCTPVSNSSLQCWPTDLKGADLSLSDVESQVGLCQSPEPWLTISSDADILADGVFDSDSFPECQQPVVRIARFVAKRPSSRTPASLASNEREISFLPDSNWCWRFFLRVVRIPLVVSRSPIAWPKKRLNEHWRGSLDRPGRICRPLFARHRARALWRLDGKPGDLKRLDEWALGGQRFGIVITWFLVGGDLYTAYTVIAVPALVYSVGAYGFFAIPYAVIIYPFVFAVMPRFWTVCRQGGHLTAADFVQARFGHSALAVAVAITGLIATMPYIALQLVGIQVVHRRAWVSVRGDFPLIVAFVILALYTYKSGLARAGDDCICQRHLDLRNGHRGCARDSR